VYERALPWAASRWAHYRTPRDSANDDGPTVAQLVPPNGNDVLRNPERIAPEPDRADVKNGSFQAGYRPGVDDRLARYG
jgi:hypothetical protein